MKYRSKLLAVCFLLSSIGASGAGAKKVETWLDASVKAKAELQAELKKSGMPIVSQWMKRKQNAETFIVDVKGMDKLVLVTTGGSDGSDYDQAVWGNARLIATDGSSVWLDLVKYEYGKAGWDKPRMNINAYGKPLSVGGKKFEHGVFCHAEGMLVYALNKKYIRFEAEVGIDDQSQSGSVYFQALNVIPSDIAQKLQAQYPKEAGLLSNVFGGLETWLISGDTSIEKNAIKKQIGKLNESTYYLEKLNQIEKEKQGIECTKA